MTGNSLHEEGINMAAYENDTVNLSKEYDFMENKESIKCNYEESGRKINVNDLQVIGSSLQSNHLQNC